MSSNALISIGGGGNPASPSSLTSCPSCGGSYQPTGANQPLIITCGDTFCRRCIQDLTDTCGTLVCPVCGEVNDEEGEHHVNRLALSLISKNSTGGGSSPGLSIDDTTATHERSRSDVPNAPKILDSALYGSPLMQRRGVSFNAAPTSIASTTEQSGPVTSVTHDHCGACDRDFSQSPGKEELQHCAHCGKAVCAVCKGEHKMQVLDRLHASRAKIQEKMEDMRFSQQYKKETLAQLKLQGYYKLLLLFPVSKTLNFVPTTRHSYESSE
ncbi:uncharacterized protein LOC142334844 [Convolutriloba macropyga]|uniref:uncharacterized protein LOC142334844 n=1 Tax=Convolutriloba macropyga TaxID=536237 RepID=UPI003F51F1C8